MTTPKTPSADLIAACERLSKAGWKPGQSQHCTEMFNAVIAVIDAYEAMSQVVAFPFEKTVTPPPNDPMIEIMYTAVEPHEPASAKRTILLFRSPEVQPLSDAQARILISSLGLEDA